MVDRVHLWWKQIKHHPVITLLIPVLIALILTILIGGYAFHWAWTGFTGTAESYKTLYDWLQLLFVPIALTGFGFYLSYRERKAAERHADKERQEEERRAEYEQKAAARRAEEELKLEQQRAQTEREVAVDNQCEEALQAYIDEMSELLLYENLRSSKEDDEVRSIARVRTLTVLPRLDGLRKGSVLQFLYESRLISKDKPIIDLNQANFNNILMLKANLRQANLQNASLIDGDLSDGDLTEANLSHASLMNAKLNRAQLVNANLRFSDLTVADLTFTDLHDAFLTDAILSRANVHMTNLHGADLSRADLSMAKIFITDLSEANLSDANLSDAKVTPKQLAKAKSLKGATMPDGSIHP